MIDAVKSRPLVTEMAREMESRLREKDLTWGYEGWHGCDHQQLMDRIRLNLGELSGLFSQTSPSKQGIRKKCADISNLAAMIMDNYTNIPSRCVICGSTNIHLRLDEVTICSKCATRIRDLIGPGTKI